MNGLLLALSFIMFVAILMVAPADGASATLFALPIAALVGWTIYILKEDRPFLFRLFISAFLVRVLIGTLIYGLRLQEFFGGDALTYDYFGHALVQVWDGNKSYQGAIDVFSGGGAASGWGMLYMVGAIYKIIGRNMLAVQYVNSILGAATAPIAYLIAMEIFPNRRVARACALLSAFFPSLVLWSCQGLKDGPIVFLLTLSMLATLKLGNRFSFKYLTALALCLCGLLTLRFYVFYIVVLAIIAAFVLGRRRLTAQSFARQFIIMIVIGLALAYFGVSRYATQQFDAYGSFEQLQRMRLDASQSAGSGFGQDVDVSTAAGAISAIPLGLSYLLLAPFPWQMASVRSVITLPEMVIWWSSLPLLVLGAWFTIKYKLREVAPILIFTTLLTLTYSILQGNVGTAYRQRAQLLVFYFVFVAVGFVLMKEKREERARRRKEARSESRGKLRWGPDRPASEDHMPVAG
ncbi:MAG TPA: glycosyltransferase family 39 protein [Pyrinomonadaceae bacterium]|nr:glycosyltransferase family 39 protein [Pyrinomonadaceae bacterium]